MIYANVCMQMLSDYIIAYHDIIYANLCLQMSSDYVIVYHDVTYANVLYVNIVVLSCSALARKFKILRQIFLVVDCHRFCGLCELYCCTQ